MKVLVCGARAWVWPELIQQRLAILPAISHITHGNAIGADRMAGEAAEALGFSVQIFLPDWNRFGKSAGFRRNVEMLDDGQDLVIAFVTGEARGTHHTIREANARGIPVEVHVK